MKNFKFSYRKTRFQVQIEGVTDVKIADLFFTKAS